MTVLRRIELSEDADDPDGEVKYPSGSGRLSSFLELKQVSEVLT
jgi:hypothetical protein